MGLPDHCIEIINGMEDIENFKDICLDITGAKEYLELSLKDNVDNKNCIQFMLWMYDYVIKNLNDNSNYTKSKRVIKQIKSIWSKYSKWSSCDILKFIDSDNNFEKLKYAYDYYLDYDTIKNQLSINNFKCTENVTHYINKIVLFYKQAKEECNDSSKKYCNELQDIFNESFSKNLSGLKCNEGNAKEMHAIRAESYNIQQESHEQNHHGPYPNNIYKAIIGPIFPILVSALVFPILYKVIINML
ncbi:hypothetical protein PGO_004330 [Plasmodium gonderi]|uniref:Variable surface protein n=1 Tax=Plasmodium gonderi TaxID=77519 RepID=A0A1Y1JY29_PLAGO|nr:hypothetical protein PGO_004330 [Plasmodium gonderi]GAW84674.1 hypothetical protein PGO_004330 [Plasmodium gonderi]